MREEDKGAKGRIFGGSLHLESMRKKRILKEHSIVTGQRRNPRRCDIKESRRGAVLKKRKSYHTYVNQLL